MTTPAPLDRRTVLRGGAVVGLVVVGAPALQACSSPSNGAGPQTTTVKAADVPVGGGVVEDASGVVVVQPAAGEFKAYSAICPHQGCTVDQISNGEIHCPCHGSTFRVSDGAVLQGPATQGLMVLTTTVKDGSVVVTL